MSVTVHHGTSFAVSNDQGDIDPGGDEGFFQLDTRFLSRHELRLDGKPPVLLQHSRLRDDAGLYFLTNPPLDGATRSTLGVVVRRELDGALHESLEIENYSGGTARFDVTLSFDADFEYILTVKRRLHSDQEDTWSAKVKREVRGDREVVLQLDESGEPHRTKVTFDPAPDALDDHQARFRVALGPRGRFRATMHVSASIDGRPRRAAGRQTSHPPEESSFPRITSDHPVLARAFERASRDVVALRIKATSDGSGEDGGGGEYAIAAGIPWYMDLFGRDSLIASYESVLHDPALARGTLEALTRLQGKKVDHVSEEAPGKILHEFRRGPLTPAARKLIPTYPYYGTIDATPLFLVTLSEYVRVTGDLAFAQTLWSNVEAALDWMRIYGDRDGDGLLEYARGSDAGLVNQGWKDSSDSVQFRDGRIAKAPIALVEVQGYAYDARRRIAELARRLGKSAEAARLDEEADALKRRIRDHFWLAARAFYAEALDGSKRPVDALTSNPGHLLWSGAVDDEHARAIARVLLGPEMFSGFGIRTMGEREGGYNPISYHDGSVWPHDNAIILAGLLRYGLREEATRLATGLLAALGAFPDAEPPELFCGYSAEAYAMPVRYPTACRPQAWSSAAVILLLRCILGLDVDALERTVSLAPLPVPGMTTLEVHNLSIGGSGVDIAVRIDGGTPHVRCERLPAGWRSTPSS